MFNIKICTHEYKDNVDISTSFLIKSHIILGTGGVQGQGKGQRLMGIKAVNDSIGLATCQSKIYEK